MKLRKIWIMAGMMLIAGHSSGQETQTIVYKQASNKEWSIKYLKPAIKAPQEGYPAIVFYFGGGWKQGSPSQFIKQAKALQQKGMVAFLVDYRTEENAGTTPRESVMDAKSAMRYIKLHASELGIDTTRIVTSGGSAGGHLAAATCYVDKINDPTDDLSISTRPAAMVLFNPVIDNSEKGYGYERVKEYYQDFSPMHNIHHPVPTLFMLGTQDHLIPVNTALKYQSICESMGGRCDVKLFEGCEHGFFNKLKYKETLDMTIEFLQSLGYIE